VRCSGHLHHHKTKRHRLDHEARTHALKFTHNLDAKRDWGYAPEYVVCMWQMLQRETPDDFVLGTGETHSVQEYVEKAFAYAGLDWTECVEIDPKYFRPTEVEVLVSDPTKARQKLNWNPKVRFNDLVKVMVDADMRAMGLEPIGDGDAILKNVSEQVVGCGLMLVNKNKKCRTRRLHEINTTLSF
jgi:nucleoside-diphosphate-sugar epimerase